MPDDVNRRSVSMGDVEVPTTSFVIDEATGNWKAERNAPKLVQRPEGGWAEEANRPIYGSADGSVVTTADEAVAATVPSMTVTIQDDVHRSNMTTYVSGDGSIRSTTNVEGGLVPDEDDALVAYPIGSVIEAIQTFGWHPTPEQVEAWQASFGLSPSQDPVIERDVEVLAFETYDV
jgi:hypothetical protein